MAVSQRGNLGGRVIKVKLSDSVGVSSGPKGSSGSSGGKGGGGGIRARVETQQQRNEKIRQEQQAAAQAKKAKDQKAYREQAIRAQQEQSRIYEEKKRKANRKDDEYETTTGKYEKGGAIIQETKGDFKTLQFLAAQQPGSSVVQNAVGEYVLIRSSGLNFGNEGTLAKLNENINLEGGTGYTPTSKKNIAGGTDYLRKVKDSISGDEGKKPIEGKGEPFEKPKGTIATRYKVDVGSNIISQQFIQKQGKYYSITLTEGGQKKEYQKTRALSAREIAEGMTKGEIPLGYISSKGAAGFITREEEGPQTYVDSRGNPIVTITGQSPGSEFGIFQKVKEGKAVPQSESSVLNFLEAKQPKKKLSNIELAGQTALNIGIDIVSGAPFLETGVPKYTKPVKEKLGEYRKENQVDLLMDPDRWGEINPASREFIIPASVYALSSFVGGKPNLKIKGPSKAPIKTEPVEVPPFKQTVMKNIFKDDTALYGWQKETVPLGRKYIPDPQIISTGPRKPINVKLDPDYRPSKVPVSRDSSVFKEDTVLAGITTEKIMLGKSATKQTQTPIKPGTQKISLGKGTGKSLKGEITKTKLPLGSGSYKVIQKEIPPQPRTNINLGKGTGKSLRGEMTTTKQPLGSGAYKIITREPIPPRQTKIGLGYGLIKNLKGEFISEKVGLGWGAGKKPYITKVNEPPKPVQLDPDYRVPKWGSLFYPREGASIYSETKFNLGRGIIRYSDTGIQKSNKAAKDFDKKIRKSKPPADAEERVSKGLISLMKEPPFKTTKIELGKSDQTLQIRDGKVIQDSIKKTGKASSPPQPFSIPPSTGSTFAPIPVGYPQGTKANLMPIFAPPTQQGTEISPQKNIHQIDTNINILNQITNPKISTNIITKRGTITAPKLIQREMAIQQPKLRETQRQKQPQLLRPRYKAPTLNPTKQPQQLTPQFRQKTIQRQVLEEVPPPKPPIIIPVWGIPPRARKRERKDPAPLGPTKQWRGNVPEFEITGIYKKEVEIRYDKKRRGKKKPSFDKMVRKIF